MLHCLSLMTAGALSILFLYEKKKQNLTPLPNFLDFTYKIDLKSGGKSGNSFFACDEEEEEEEDQYKYT